MDQGTQTITNKKVDRKAQTIVIEKKEIETQTDKLESESEKMTRNIFEIVTKLQE